MNVIERKIEQFFEGLENETETDEKTLDIDEEVDLIEDIENDLNDNQPMEETIEDDDEDFKKINAAKQDQVLEEITAENDLAKILNDFYDK